MKGLLKQPLTIHKRDRIKETPQDQPEKTLLNALICSLLKLHLIRNNISRDRQAEHQTKSLPIRHLEELGYGTVNILQPKGMGVWVGDRRTPFSALTVSYS